MFSILARRPCSPLFVWVGVLIGLKQHTPHLISILASAVSYYLVTRTILRFVLRPCNRDHGVRRHREYQITYLAAVFFSTRSCRMRQVRAWPNMNSVSDMAAAAGAI